MTKLLLLLLSASLGVPNMGPLMEPAAEPTPGEDLTYNLFNETANENVSILKTENNKNIYETIEGHTYKIKYTLASGYVFENQNSDETLLNSATCDIDVTLPIFRAVNTYNITVPKLPGGMNLLARNLSTGMQMMNSGLTAEGDMIFTVNEGEYVQFSFGLTSENVFFEDELKSIVTIANIHEDQLVTLPIVKTIESYKISLPNGVEGLTYKVVDVTNNNTILNGVKNARVTDYKVVEGHTIKIEYQLKEGYETTDKLTDVIIASKNETMVAPTLTKTAEPTKTDNKTLLIVLIIVFTTIELFSVTYIVLLSKKNKKINKSKK